MKLLAAASAIALGTTAPAPHQHHGHGPQLGKVEFATSCSRDADARVREGLGWLHSFEYETAAKTFAAAAASDPRCAIAHWGVAMSYYHPLWAPPTTAEIAKAQAALAKARENRPATAREQAYVDAIQTFYADADRVDHKTRALAYSDAMGRLHERYPDDREAAIFHALSLIAAGMMDKDPAFAREKQAGAILNRVLAAAPDHPGVAHYLIHNFDYPSLAELALPAARRYAGLAPASPHAQHMPSHIFVRLGLWEDSIRSNLASEAAARAFAKAQGLDDSSSERLHAMDYLAYGYLQTGQDAAAERVLASLNAIRRVDPPAFSVAFAATAIPARLTLERRQWREAAKLELKDNVRKLAPLENFRWGEAHLHFARAVGAARSGDAAAARAEVAKLEAIEQALTVTPGSYDWRTQVAIERQIAQAWLARAEKRNADAERLMRAAADLDDASEKHPVTPGAILPAREQLGELLLELGRPADALGAFEASMTRAPRRLVSLAGAARAARAAGDQAKARDYYKKVIELTKAADSGRAEIQEAKAFVAALAAR